MLVFSYVISRTSFDRQQRACEQDRTMTALLGINVDRTISLTFMLGAMVTGVLVTIYYGVVDFYIGFVVRHQGLYGGRTRRAADRAGGLLGGLPGAGIEGRGDLQHPDPGADVPSLLPARPP